MNRASVKHPSALSTAPAALISRIAPGVADALARAVATAAGLGARVWLVGGAVRDLLIGIDPGRDIDLAVEGDVTALAKALAAAPGARLLASHHEFGTATIMLTGADLPPGGLTLDLARTRVEVYPQPAVLPLVTPADIGADLIRRDFSLNAIAVLLRVAGQALRADTLLDPFAGRDDLAAGRLRLLHAQSLRDDPTRILRGLRLAARLDLEPDSLTLAQISDALAQGYLGMLTPERILGELCLALAEPRPDAALARSDAWGVTQQILPGLAWSEAVEARVTRWQEAGGRWQDSAADHIEHAPKLQPPATSHQPPELLAAGLLCYDLSPAQLAALAARYPLPAPFARLFAEIPGARAAAQTLHPAPRLSQIDLSLRSYGEATISVLHYAEAGHSGQAAAHYLREVRPARPPLDGRDLQRLGLAPGPTIGKLLAALRAAYLDGEVTTRAQAEQWVQEQIAS